MTALQRNASKDLKAIYAVLNYLRLARLWRAQAADHLSLRRQAEFVFF